MITVNGEQLERARATLAGVDNGFAKAVRSALNRSSEKFQTDSVRGTTSRYHIKASVLRAGMKRKYASLSNLEALLAVWGTRKPIGEYKLVPGVPTPGRKRQLKGAVRRTGLKSLGPAFFVGDKPFFQDPDRLRPIISPSIPQIVKSENTVKEASKGATERFHKQLDHEIFRLITGAKRG